MRYRPYNPNQLRMLTPSLTDMISDASPVWILMESINGSLLKDLPVKNTDEGNTPYNPLMMTRLLVWAYADNVHSSRRIERKTYTDIEYMFLCDMNHPDFRTICRFRKQFAPFFQNFTKRFTAWLTSWA